MAQTVMARCAGQISKSGRKCLLVQFNSIQFSCIYTAPSHSTFKCSKKHQRASVRIITYHEVFKGLVYSTFCMRGEGQKLKPPICLQHRRNMLFLPCGRQCSHCCVLDQLKTSGSFQSWKYCGVKCGAICPHNLRQNGFGKKSRCFNDLVKVQTSNPLKCFWQDLKHCKQLQLLVSVLSPLKTKPDTNGAHFIQQ